ncbi:hypothetical protein, partial [Escherichia coli]|uniref:hypothetical protein n=1 Tax=Escherichia coli TaxID=562 RepID=UPI001114F5C7
MRDIINFNTDCAIVFHACPPGRLFFLYAEKNAVLVLLHQLVQLIRHTAPHHLRWPGCLLGALAEYRLDPGHPHRPNLTGVI